MIVSEMDVQLVYPESCFQATTAPECFRELQAWHESTAASSRKLTISSAVALLCRSTLEDETLDLLVSTNVSNMLSFVMGMIYLS